MSAPSLVVLIPTHGRPTLLRRTLDSVAACALPETYTECVVIENGSPSGAEAVVQSAAAAHPHVALRYLHHERANKSSALNAALEHVSSAALCVFLDDDVRLEPEALVAYATAAESNSGRVYFGGPVSCDYEAPPPDWILSSLPHSAKGYELEDRGTMSGEYLGFNWAAYARDLSAVGGFDPRVGPGSPTGARGQETEMQSRLREAGARPVDVEAARVWHYVPSERCSVRWILQRSNAMGRSVGATSAQPMHDEDTVIWSAVRSALSLSKRALLLDRKGILSAAQGFAYNWGRLKSLGS